MQTIAIEYSKLANFVTKHGFNSTKDMMKYAGLKLSTTEPNTFRDKDNIPYYRFQIIDEKQYVYFSLKYGTLT